MINVAIDGPAGAGKSTIARRVAARLGYIYVDTGALYRSVAWYVLSKGEKTDDKEVVPALLPEIDLTMDFIDGEQHVFVNGEDVSEAIRTPEVSMGASNVSALPPVRDFLFSLQKDLAEKHNVLMDGRDIGTVVLPDADVKIFLTASPEERAERRVRQLEEKGIHADYDSILKEIIQRDYNDSHREAAPLKQADDAVLADTTKLNLEESVALIEKIIQERLGR